MMPSTSIWTMAIVITTPGTFLPPALHMTSRKLHGLQGGQAGLSTAGRGAVGSSCATDKTAANPLQCVGPSNKNYSGFGLVSDTAGDFFGAPGIGAGEAFNMQLVAKIIF